MTDFGNRIPSINQLVMPLRREQSVAPAEFIGPPICLFADVSVQAT